MSIDSVTAHGAARAVPEHVLTSRTASNREIPFDYVARFRLKGKRNERTQEVINISVEGMFIATSIGYSFIPKLIAPPPAPSSPGGGTIERLSFDPGRRADATATVTTAGTTATTSTSSDGGATTSAAPGAGVSAEWLAQNASHSQWARWLLYLVALSDPNNEGNVYTSLSLGKLLDWITQTTQPATLVQKLALQILGIDFKYTIVDSATGRELQNLAVHNIAGLGTPGGERPFRPLPKPMLFAPRSTIRIEIEELSDGPLYADAELQIVFHGYKVLGAATP